MERVDYQSMIVQDLINDNADEKIDLTPWYQRRSVWTRPQKAYLINTLFEGKPIPALYIRHSIDMEKGKSVKEIVDGQQRARTIIEYCAGEFAAKTEIAAERQTFAQLKRAAREKFLLTPIPIGFLLGADDRDVIDIFARINSVSKTLNNQEKRNALYSGEMKQFCLHESSSRLTFWREYNVFSANDIARMNEVQFISDVVYNMLNGISDFRQTDINRLYAENDEDFADARSISARLSAIFEKLYALDRKAIVDTIFRRQPLFFSLILALDAKRRISVKTIENALHEIDALFNDDDVTDNEIVAFRTAVASSTQRITSRRVRDEFLKSRL